MLSHVGTGSYHALRFFGTLSLLILAACRSREIQAQQVDPPAAAGVSAPKLPTLRPSVSIETTLGNMTVELDAEHAPGTVVNFVDYVNDGFYNGTTFHRVVQDGLIQGGIYTKDFETKSGSLRPGIRNESNNSLLNARGAIAMFRRPMEPHSAQAQFFINVAENTQLDRLRDGFGYTVFGRVTEGLDTLDKIRNTPVGPHPRYAAGKNPLVPQKPVVIQAMRMLTPLDREKAVSLAAEFRDEFQRKLDRIVSDLERTAQTSAVTLPSGIRFVDMVGGKGASPLETDTVDVYYRATLLDGTEFETSERDGQRTRKVPVSTLLKGLREGIATMREGGKRTLVVPPALAFGPAGMPGKVPPNSTIIFEIELIEVLAGSTTPPKP